MNRFQCGTYFHSHSFKIFLRHFVSPSQRIFPLVNYCFKLSNMMRANIIRPVSLISRKSFHFHLQLKSSSFFKPDFSQKLHLNQFKIKSFKCWFHPSCPILDRSRRFHLALTQNKVVTQLLFLILLSFLLLYRIFSLYRSL